MKLHVPTLFAFALVLPAFTADWIHLPPDEGLAKDKKIVFVTGDDEYKSETSMPMMAHILADRHGFDCTVLFAINRTSGVIDTNQRDNIPGLEALAAADLMVVYTRFRTLEDAQMKRIEDYLDSGRPVIGLRTATHAFDFSKKPDSPFAKYSYNYQGEDYPGGFGRQVLGETWIRHWGHHGKQSSRGRFAPGMAAHPILRGIANGEIWGPTDVYGATLPLPEGCEAVLLGEVCETMRPDSAPAPAPPPGAKGRQAIDKNQPMMPIAWTYRRDTGVKGRVFTSTIGGAMAGNDDWANEGMRRMFVNACYWTLELEDQIPAKSDVTPVLHPNPFRRGVKPVEALQQGLADRKAKKATILFYGNSMVERLLEHGELEARLQIALPNEKLKIRSLAWTGDEVGNRLRLEGYAKHMKNLLKAWPANTIVLGYGLNEAFAGEAGLPEFRRHYRAHLKQLAGVHPGARFVLLSPISTENVDTKLYSQAIRELAAEHGTTFVDLHSATEGTVYVEKNPGGQNQDVDGIGKYVPAFEYTTNGIHLNDAGSRVVAKTVADALLKLRGTAPTEPALAHLREVARAASAKHFRVAELVRPKNAVVYFGVRARPYEYDGEMPRYHEMIRLTEEVVHTLAADPSRSFASMPTPSLAPMGEGRGNDDGDRTGIIKSVAEQQAEFKVADGYAINVFASEETFPELRNPVQIAFDARGRLWVVTMPSFPHTVPGLQPPDKLLVLEDTDGDGVADKMTPFAEGLDALDGVAFHRDGVIVSEQPKLWLMRDTDGDDRADTRVELLRGIDVTDSHHGGMIATDPMGDVIFSDGVFHRSQLETPFGVLRGIDATTYRLDPATGRIQTEWQHTTPNPWNVTFNRWGNIFQMYGDGDVYDGSSLIWTPLGAYQPYAYGRMTSYGKGCGTAVISSPNFPDKVQQGIASASLLGRYAVNLTILSDEEGMMKQESYDPIVSSHNAAFRPVDLEFGLDGALYVSDFCSPIIGHAQHPMRDPHWDHDYGRIWRIVHTGKPLVKERPVIEGASPEALCELLTHPQDLIRHHARIELRKHGEKGLAAVDRWIAAFDRSHPEAEQADLEALFVCEGLGETRSQLLERLLASKDHKYRGAAVQLLRLQADRIDGVKEKLAALVNDPHPRVQIEVIDAVAHLRPIHPGVGEILATIDASNKHVSKSLSTLDHGIEPAKGRSVPVLDVAKASQLTHWHYLGKDGEDAPAELRIGQDKPSATGLFRTFVISEIAQPAIVAINHKNLEIRVNDALVFSQNSLWSGDQQVNVGLVPGLNAIEVLLRPGRRSGGFPPVYLYDPVGEALSGATYPESIDRFREGAAAYQKMIEERGNLLHVQAVAGLLFSPQKLRVAPGSKVRLVFDNPDVMIHNWVLLKPGSFEEVGALADQLAAQPDGMAKAYLPDTDKILTATQLVGPTEREEIVFTAPSEPGDYPYVCTFPGHWRIMKGTLVVAPPNPAKVVSAPTPKKAATKAAPTAITKTIGEGVLFETASSLRDFKTLVPPSKPSGTVLPNRTTNNDPVATLTDGKLAKSFGPVFANGIKNGAYRMDLGSVKSVTAITSWAYQQSGKRGAQRVTLYGSAHATDPGWELSDKTRYVPLGTIGTEGQTLQPFTALSRRAESGKSLGDFRWIVWRVSPVTELDENTAFQELAVEVGTPSKAAAKAPQPKPAKSTSRAGARPNVILVMTDDQGYGEVGFHGNPALKTPNLDRFAAEGTELVTFYVSPMCTPTRSSLMTGRYHYRTGAHDTYIGRSNMNPQETTIAEIFAEAGYRTGIFGKWHLGENYPMRAQDQGFQKVVVHGGGGIGQFADVPGNTYWDPTLLYNDAFKKAKGYCTDVFIDESIRFIRDSGDTPFFCYIPLNIPHSPFDVAKKFREPYDRQKLTDPDGRNWVPPIYGMITQFDQAFQRLLDEVEKMGLRENTIVIFMTDNGPNSTFYTAGLRAKKGSVYENGIRSPFVMQWPAGMKGGRKLKDTAMHIDLLPTLAEACGIELPADLKLDGLSVLDLLTGDADKLPERTVFMQHNRGNLPTKFKNGMARKGPWKMVNSSGKPNGFALYNMEVDQGEDNNLAEQHPDKLKELTVAYERWFDDVSAELRSVDGMPHPIVLDPIQKQDFRFTWQDWWGEDTGWRHTNYGGWRMTNPGKIDRFDIDIGVPRAHRGKAAILKFIWQGKTVEKKFKQLPERIALENVKLAKGTGFMEAQLLLDGKKWGVQEVRIRPHGKAPAGEGAATKAPARQVGELPVKGQFVRIEIPGRGRVLSLAEVEVFAGGKNIALKKEARQSTVGFGGEPGRAVDGTTDGDYTKHSVTHTASAGADPWWEVDLGRSVEVEKIVLHNRTDSNGERLQGFTLQVLDAQRNVVLSRPNNRQAPVMTFSKEGHVTFGQRLAEQAIDLLPKPAFPGERRDFRGFDRYKFRTGDNVPVEVICPKEAAPGKPWLWRSLFWDAITRFNQADMQLVAEGYHIILVHGDVAGHPRGNANINAAYDLLTKEYDFAKKCSMASMSRGTLSLFRWASTYPDRVESIYVDNGVCNVLSWPAGKVVPGNDSIASGAPDSWADFKKKFGYKTDAEALKTKESPIDQLQPLAKASVPILMVCGNQDKAVPYEENDAIMEQRYKALGGNITVIVENKGHSHGMKDPTPVLEFIRKHTNRP